MNIILDTQVLIWIFGQPSKLIPTATSFIKNPDNRLFVSMASFWEVAIKINLNKLDLPFDLTGLIEETLANDIEVLGIDVRHISTVATLPFYHRDPFDRLIISQSIVEDLPIISSDEQFARYAIKRFW